MPRQPFNTHRMSQLEELLEIEYEKLHGFERAIAMADGVGQKISLRLQIKRELTPRLRQLEQDYAELLVSGVSTENISESDADKTLVELTTAVDRAEEISKGTAPNEMVELLKDIKAKLSDPGKSATAKLKVALPIVPMIASYEMELDTEAVVTHAWWKVRDFFKGLLANPQ